MILFLHKHLATCSAYALNYLNIKLVIRPYSCRPTLWCTFVVRQYFASQKMHIFNLQVRFRYKKLFRQLDLEFFVDIFKEDDIIRSICIIFVNY